MTMTRPLYASKLIFALLGAIAWMGCTERMSIDILSETDDPVYRRAKDLLARDLNSEALSNFDKLIMMRNGTAPESHLEAGLIYLDHMNDPVSAIYHFNRYKMIKRRERKSSQVDASVARVEGLVKTAMKELLSSLDAQVYRLKLLDTIQLLRDENEILKSKVADSRKGIFKESSAPIALSGEVSDSGRRAAPQRPGAESTPPRQRRLYVVKARDSLYKISREVYGDGSRWEEILRANRATLPSANQLQPGMSLIIP